MQDQTAFVLALSTLHDAQDKDEAAKEAANDEAASDPQSPAPVADGAADDDEKTLIMGETSDREEPDSDEDEETSSEEESNDATSEGYTPVAAPAGAAPEKAPKRPSGPIPIDAADAARAGSDGVVAPKLSIYLRSVSASKLQVNLSQAITKLRALLNIVEVDNAGRSRLEGGSATSTKLPLLAKPKWMFEWEDALLKSSAPTVAPQAPKLNSFHH